MQERRRMRQALADTLLQEQQRSLLAAQAFEERLAALREQHHSFSELADPRRKLLGLQEVIAAYADLREELQEVKRFLREQRAGYSLLRREYERELSQLHVLKQAIKHPRS